MGALIERARLELARLRARRLCLVCRGRAAAGDYCRACLDWDALIRRVEGRTAARRAEGRT